MQQDLFWWKATVITTMTTASVSLVASSALSIKIASSGLDSPYRRLIFGLSISDVMQSAALITGAFSTPDKSVVPQAIWGMGNRATCAANGFFFSMGMGCMPMYFCAICYYYLCKLKKNMTDDSFCKGREWKIHWFIILVNFSICVVAIATQSLNPAAYGTFCTFAAFPTGCRQQPEVYGQCDQNVAQFSSFFVLLGNFIMPIVCLLVVIINMTLLCSHVLKRDRIYRASTKLTENNQAAEDGKPGADSNMGDFHGTQTTKGDSFMDDKGSKGYTIQPKENEAEYLRRLYRRETMVQACWYCLAYAVTFGSLWPLVVIYVLGNVPTDPMLFVTSLFYPLGGLFNILVFTRPAVATLRRRDPQIWWLKAFWLVFKAGGQVPKQEDNLDILGHIQSPIYRAETSVKFKVAGRYDEQSNQAQVHDSSEEIERSKLENRYYDNVMPGIESSRKDIITSTGMKLSTGLSLTNPDGPNSSRLNLSSDLSLIDDDNVASSTPANSNMFNNSLFSGLSGFGSGLQSNNEKHYPESDKNEDIEKTTDVVIRDAFAAALKRASTK